MNFESELSKSIAQNICLFVLTNRGGLVLVWWSGFSFFGERVSTERARSVEIARVSV